MTVCAIHSSDSGRIHFDRASRIWRRADRWEIGRSSRSSCRRRQSCRDREGLLGKCHGWNCRSRWRRQQTETDALGRFAFGPTTRPLGTFVAVTPTARAFASGDDLAAGKPLRLETFSYVEGTVKIRGQAAAGAIVKIVVLAQRRRRGCGGTWPIYFQRDRRRAGPLSNSGARRRVFLHWPGAKD